MFRARRAFHPVFDLALCLAAVVSSSCTHPASTAPTTPAAPPAGDVSGTQLPPTAPAVANTSAAGDPANAAATEPVTSGYDKPPQPILDLLHAPAPPQPVLSPTRDRILLVTYETYPSIAQVAEPFLRLAGVRVEPRTRRKHDTPGGYGIAPCATAMSLVDVATGRDTAVPVPPAACVDAPVWSADGKRFAFRNTSRDAVELWIGDAQTATTRRLGTLRLNPMLGSSHQWLADQKTLLVKLVPATTKPPPAGSVVSTGPSIQETDGKSGESSTYETRDTLSNRHDEDLFEYYATSQLAAVDTTTGVATPIGAPAILTDVAAAPDGDHILVSRIKKPFSYVTTYDRFAHDVEVWDRSGKVTSLAQLPVADRVPIAGVATGPREHEWRANEPATLVWAEALDKGDWNVNVPARDKLMLQRAPFTSPPVEIARTEQRYAGFEWSEQKQISLLHQYDENKHWDKTFVVDIDNPKAKPSLLWDLSSDERYKNPGSPVYRVLPDGEWVIDLDDQAIFLRGQGASPDGDRPFLDRLDLATRKTERLWRCDKTSYESFLAFTDAAHKNFLTWHQSPIEPPNAFARTLGAATTAPAGEAAFATTARAVTKLPDPTPQVRSIKKRLVKYKRKDGVELSFTLYTPPDYKEGTRVPAILYAYPLDYASTKTAGQVSGSEQVFTRLRDYRLLLASGYAIIDNAAFPIVGDPKKAYDTYLDQLVADARAAVDKAVELGVVDRDRIGVTGHSHGALMTANLIAHTDLFRAGVATSGSYNKTLTPFGFQSERRSVWKAQKVYLQASTFFFADKIKLPLLIMHGADDANPGTTPLQAVKLYEAIRGNGGTARLVMLPHEPHWYTAMESNEQLAYEELRWFDRYVKNAPPRAKTPAKTPAKPAK
ncbi:MAG TPA: prolyl oligopeptidase family serine peptidase [Kofleriaceae bacterium]|nr:prolyl oligopeptidase family serine peptidase [Kofleriaceae bacterium]